MISMIRYFRKGKTTETVKTAGLARGWRKEEWWGRARMILKTVKLFSIIL